MKQQCEGLAITIFLCKYAPKPLQTGVTTHTEWLWCWIMHIGLNVYLKKWQCVVFVKNLNHRHVHISDCVRRQSEYVWSSGLKYPKLKRKPHEKCQFLKPYVLVCSDTPVDWIAVFSPATSALNRALTCSPTPVDPESRLCAVPGSDGQGSPDCVLYRAQTGRGGHSVGPALPTLIWHPQISPSARVTSSTRSN